MGDVLIAVVDSVEPWDGSEGKVSTRGAKFGHCRRVGGALITVVDSREP